MKWAKAEILDQCGVQIVDSWPAGSICSKICLELASQADTKTLFAWRKGKSWQYPGSDRKIGIFENTAKEDVPLEMAFIAALKEWSSTMVAKHIINE